MGGLTRPPGNIQANIGLQMYPMAKTKSGRILQIRSHKVLTEMIIAIEYLKVMVKGATIILHLKLIGIYMLPEFILSQYFSNLNNMLINIF